MEGLLVLVWWLVLIWFVFILHCIHSKLSCPDRYFCNPVYSFHNSKARAMEKGFISNEFCVKNGIRQGLVDLYVICSTFCAQDSLSFPGSWKKYLFVSGNCYMLQVPNSFIATSMSCYQKQEVILFLFQASLTVNGIRLVTNKLTYIGNILSQLYLLRYIG